MGKCGCGYYFEGRGTLCDNCLLKKYGLEFKKKAYRGVANVPPYDDFDYYKKEDVVKALRKASGEK